jgi:hypothetical protein
MKKSRAAGRPAGEKTLLSDRGGAVYVEFLLSFIPLFFLFLGMVQMGLLYAADLVVRHAAVTATRAAIVVLDDNPERYGGDGRRAFETDGDQRDTIIRSVIETLLPGSGGPTSRPPRIDSERYSAIHSAASMPLLPFAPPVGMIWRSPADENVLSAIGTMPEGRAAFGLVYNEAGLAVSFPNNPVAREFRSSWGAPNDEGIVSESEGRAVTARVTYLFHCAVPLANRLMCEDLFAIAYGVDIGRVAQITQAFIRGDLSYMEFLEELNGLRISRERIDRWRPRTEELQGAGGEIGIDLLGAMAGISAIFGGPQPRFVPIQREATMPLQAANYCYHDAGDSGDCWEQELH